MGWLLAGCWVWFLELNNDVQVMSTQTFSEDASFTVYITIWLSHFYNLPDICCWVFQALHVRMKASSMMNVVHYAWPRVPTPSHLVPWCVHLAVIALSTRSSMKILHPAFLWRSVLVSFHSVCVCVNDINRLHLLDIRDITHAHNTTIQNDTHS